MHEDNPTGWDPTNVWVTAYQLAEHPALCNVLDETTIRHQVRMRDENGLAAAGAVSMATSSKRIAIHLGRYLRWFEGQTERFKNRKAGREAA